MKIPNFLSQLEKPPAVAFLSFYLPHTLNYPYGKERMQKDDWQDFLTWASLWPHFITLEKESKAASIDPLFWAAGAVARIFVRKRMSLFRHVCAASDIFCLSMNVWHHLPHCIGAVTNFFITSYSWVHELLSALLNYFNMLSLVFYVELWSSHMPENPW